MSHFEGITPQEWTQLGSFSSPFFKSVVLVWIQNLAFHLHTETLCKRQLEGSKNDTSAKMVAVGHVKPHELLIEF